MKTVFGLFSVYENLQSALTALQAQDFDPAEANVIVQAKIAKDSMEVNLLKEHHGKLVAGYAG